METNTTDSMPDGKRWPSQAEVLKGMQKAADKLLAEGRKPTEEEAYGFKHLITHMSKAEGKEIEPDIQKGIDEIRKKLNLN